MTQQIVKINEEYIEELSKLINEPDWLKKFRLDAFRTYSEIPEEQSNLYTKYGLNLNVNPAELSRKFGSIKQETIPISELASGMESGFYYVGTQKETIASKNIRELERKGIIFCDLHEAIEKHEHILKKIFQNKAIPPSSDKFAALNSALFSSSWLVYFPRDTMVDQPLRLRFYLESTLPVFSQTWIYAEQGSKVTLLTEGYGGQISGTVSDLVEAHVQDNAFVQYSNVQSYSDDTVVLSNKKAICNKDARISWILGYFGGRAERSRLESTFVGEGASAEDVEVVFGNGYQRYDLVADLSHVAGNTKGRILCNSVLKDNARSVFKGMIRIGKEAKNSNAYLAGHAILLSPNAKSDAIPGLEILTNEVKATHSASVQQIDDEQIFYMMSRGIPEEEARKFIVLGFLEPAISRIESQELRDTIHSLLNAKWEGKKGLVIKSKEEVLFEEDKPTTPQDIFEGHYKYR
ncbi:MAG: Fe-S cluster assembly protein SufD [Nitrososphaerales archaeon]